MPVFSFFNLMQTKNNILTLFYCFYLWHDWLTEYVTRCYYMVLNLDPNSQLVIALNYLLAWYTTIDKTAVYTYPFCALVAKLLSKQKYISQISLELERYTLKINTQIYQTDNIQVPYHRRISIVFLLWHEGRTGEVQDYELWGPGEELWVIAHYYISQVP